MQIITNNYPGYVNHEEDKSIFHIPVVFKNFKTGPKGITNISVERVEINEKKFNQISRVTIHKFKPSDERNNGIIGQSIPDRPIYFTKTDNDPEYPIVLNFELIQSDIDIKAISSDSTFKFILKINFTNNERISFLISGKLNPTSKEITLGPITRLQNGKRTFYNYLFFTIITLSLFGWNLWFNNGIHEVDQFFGQKTISTVSGILLGFLGLTIGKLKSVFSSFDELQSLYVYPELHLALRPFRRLPSNVWSIIILFFAIGSGVVGYINWSHEIKNLPSNYEVYDNFTKEKVRKSRIYRNQLKNKTKRFFLICKSDNLPKNPYFLGHISSTGEAIINPVNIEIFKGNSENIADEKLKVQNLLQFSFDNALFKNPPDLNEIICGNEFKKEQKIDGLNIIAIKNQSHSELLKLEIRDKKVTSYAEINGVLQKFKQDEFNPNDLLDIYKNRLKFIGSLKERINQKLGSNVIVSFDSIIYRITIDELKKIQGRDGDPKKRIIERNIMLSSLWQATIKSRSNSPSLNQIKSIILETEKSFGKGVNENRSLVEFLLEIQSLNEGISDNLPHEFIVQKWIDSKKDKAEQKQLLTDYISILALKKREKLKSVVSFLKKNYVLIREHHGHENYLGLYSLIINRNLSNSNFDQPRLEMFKKNLKDILIGFES